MLSFLFSLLVGFAVALPATRLGVHFEKRQDALPILTLPYGQFQASSYNALADVSHPVSPVHHFICSC